MENLRNPTISQFKAFENAYDYFNAKLFNNELPSVILNLSRKSKNMGFAAASRWRKTDDEKGKGNIHELSINPEILSMSLIDVYSTLVHEQAHIWQFSHGTPSRNNYHNKEWADKMLSIGLIPSDTGKEGGNMTGQSMSDYPKKEGVFLKALEEMPENFKLPFVSIEGDLEDIAAPKPTSKNKYACPCGCNVWGKIGLNILCGDCGGKFTLNLLKRN
jgi:SprT-like family